MTGINLIPAETALRRGARLCMRRWGARLAAGAVLTGLLYGGLARLVVLRTAELTHLKQTHALLQEHLQTAQRALEERDGLARQYDAIALLRKHRGAGWYLDLLAETLPAGSYLSSLDLGHGDESGGGTTNNAEAGDTLATELRMRGHADGQQEVGQIIRRMSEANCFATVNLVSLTDQQDAERASGVDFEIWCGAGATAK